MSQPNILKKKIMYVLTLDQHLGMYVECQCLPSVYSIKVKTQDSMFAK